MKVFLDTNIWFRYLLQDNEQSVSCNHLMQAIDEGKVQPFTSSIVLLEIFFVMTSPRVYGVDKAEILKDLQKCMEMRNLVIIEETKFKEAVELSLQSKIKLADCLIITQVPKNIVFCTYDQELKKVHNFDVKTPAEILATLK